MILLKVKSDLEGVYYYDISSVFNCETDGTGVEVSFLPGVNNKTSASGNVKLDCAKNAVTESMIIALNNAIVNASSAPGSTVDFNEVTGIDPEQQRIQTGSNIPQIS